MIMRKMSTEASNDLVTSGNHGLGTDLNYILHLLRRLRMSQTHLMEKTTQMWN